MTYTKADIIKRLSQTMDFDKEQSKHIIEELFSLIRESFKNGEDIVISGFGAFKLRRKGTRWGRNPRTGETAKIKERNVVVFKVSQKFRQLLNSNP